MDHLWTWPPWICFKLPMGDMLPSTTNMTSLKKDMDKDMGYDPPSNEYRYASTSYGGYASTSYGGYASPNSWICLSQLEQQHHELYMSINTLGLVSSFKGGKLIAAWT